MPIKAIDLTGRAFGRLMVLERSENGGKEPRWLCACICGRKKVVFGSSLKSGQTRSCGCIAREVTRARSITHGMFGSPEWRAWASMRSRCLVPTNRNYANYGGRGITVCVRWRDSFEAFYRDMGPRPSPHHQIDRINNNAGYEPNNCRWATRAENQRNRRTTVRYGGLTLREISERTGENYYTLKTRAFRGLMQRDK